MFDYFLKYIAFKQSYYSVDQPSGASAAAASVRTGSYSGTKRGLFNYLTDRNTRAARNKDLKDLRINGMYVSSIAYNLIMDNTG